MLLSPKWLFNKHLCCMVGWKISFKYIPKIGFYVWFYVWSLPLMILRDLYRTQAQKKLDKRSHQDTKPAGTIQPSIARRNWNDGELPSLSHERLRLWSDTCLSRSCLFCVKCSTQRDLLLSTTARPWVVYDDKSTTPGSEVTRHFCQVDLMSLECSKYRAMK